MEEIGIMGNYQRLTSSLLLETIYRTLASIQQLDIRAALGNTMSKHNSLTKSGIWMQLTWIVTGDRNEDMDCIGLG
jgi:hypothetical protein